MPINFVRRDHILSSDSCVGHCVQSTHSPSASHVDRGTATDFSYSDGVASGVSDDGGPNDSEQSRSQNTESLRWLIEELKSIKNKDQLTRLIEDVRSKNIDMTPWEHGDCANTPIILMMKKSYRWLSVGLFYCPFCENLFNTSASLHAHWLKEHGKRIVSNEQAAIEYIYNMKIRWKIHENITPCYR